MTPGFDSFPMWGIAVHLGRRESLIPSPKLCISGEESLTPSPCAEGLTGKESCAFKRKEASLLPLVRKDLWEGYLPTISNRWGKIALHLGRDYPFEHIKKLILL